MSFNPYSPGFSIYFLLKTNEQLRSTVASILIHLDFLSICVDTADEIVKYQKLQSLFTWIFYLFSLIITPRPYFQDCFNPYSPGFSIYLEKETIKERINNISFNPYSPGFSIYLEMFVNGSTKTQKLQSLFTWIFYLFKKCGKRVEKCLKSFNPYSPGFSIYLVRRK